MPLVLRLHARATAGEVLQTAGLEADKVEPLVLVEAPSRAGEVVYRCGCRLGLHE
jgi:hypothetical protein